MLARLIIFSLTFSIAGLAIGSTASQGQQSIWGEYLSRYANNEFIVGESHRLRHRVDREKRLIKAKPGHLFAVTKRSRFFAHYLLNRCLQEGLPIELALVPMVESAFDPFAFSQGGAAGLWQFMPSTGKHFGLNSSWWFDDRRDPLRSTDAAFSYFKELHARFDSWSLAIAAYNAGPTRISRALKKNRSAGGSGQYAELSLPKETLGYLPRLLALRELLLEPSDPADVFPIKDSAFFEVMELPGQIDLGQASSLSGGAIQTLYHLNAGLNQSVTPPQGPQRLLVPSDGAETLKQGLLSAAKDMWFDWHLVEVGYGDTLGEIAQDHASRIDFIQLANGIDSYRIKTGQQLLVPALSADKTLLKEPEVIERLRGQLERMRTLRQGVRRVDYQVTVGDSWWKLARRFGVSMDELLDWNQAKSSQALREGRRIVVWLPVKGYRRDIARTIYYQVRKGDSLSGIAHRFNVSADHIIARNDLKTYRYLQPGQNLSISVPIRGQDAH